MEDQKVTKEAILRQYGTLNPHYQLVSDNLFSKSEFFDPQDMVQIKYEMLRRVRVDGMSVSHVSSMYGFSRVAFYQIQAAYEREGLAGLLPQQRGPRHAHKLSEEVVSFASSQRSNGGSKYLAELILKRFGLQVHPRSIERALSRQVKKGR